MSVKDKGLPMTGQRNPEQLRQEIAELDALARKPFLSAATGYIQRTGPGLLQSAMTLGAGSAVASVVAGASFGYTLLWVQPIAMLLGVMMLAALGNVILTTGERPYRAFGRELTVSVAFLWALGTIVASVIWHFPQYGLAAGAARDLAEMAGLTTQVTAASGATALTTTGLLVSFGIGITILMINIATTWSYGSHAKGVWIYEWFLRGVIALVIIAFGMVVVATGIKLGWGELCRGFFAFHIPAAPGTTTLVLGAIGAAVGINMTFLYPYTLLAKGWGPHHKTLARWDLGMSMFVPFVLVTSLVIIATANTLYVPGSSIVRGDLRPVEAAQALTDVMGPLGRVVFDLGFIGMTCGAISAHMVVCGFTVCEMFGLEYTVWRYRLFTLVPAVGMLGVVTRTPLWMPIAASAICLTMLPFAYIMFFILNNKKSYIGAATGRGIPRMLFNLVLLIAIAMATLGAAIKLKTGVIDKVLPTPAASAGPAVTQNR